MITEDLFIKVLTYFLTYLFREHHQLLHLAVDPILRESQVQMDPAGPESRTRLAIIYLFIYFIPSVV